MPAKMTGSITDKYGKKSKIDIDMPPMFDGPNFGVPNHEPPKVNFDNLQPVENLIDKLKVVLQGEDWNTAYNAVNAIQAMLQLSLPSGGRGLAIPINMPRGM